MVRILRKLSILSIAVLGVGVFFLKFYQQPSPTTLPPSSESNRLTFFDRYGEQLTTTYENRWNTINGVALHEIPAFLVKAFIFSEDRRFFEHGGTDFRSLLAASYQAVTSLRIVRGGSSITEQCVRLVHPRPRTLLSRAFEVLEARDLEHHFSKNQILEFYLNQVPLAARRRGVVEGARYLFDRDLSTLSEKEMLALVVMVRAPAYFDPKKYPKRVEDRISALVKAMESRGILSSEDANRIAEQHLALRSSRSPLEASHFVQYLRTNLKQSAVGASRIDTTIDGPIQRRLQGILNQRLRKLQDRGVRNGAILAVDNERNEILAWVNGGDFVSAESGSKIDAVMTPRQPGSTLKPFVYASAFEKGWTPATMIMDSPLIRPVSTGVHQFRNYSGTYHGAVTIRDALGNSLNIPAVRAVQMVGTAVFLERLRTLGFSTLNRAPDFYGEGLALGAGEVSLFELVRAYTVLASGGELSDITAVPPKIPESTRKVLSSVTTALIADILSDSSARKLEFADDSVLDFPIQTAVKTGTSTDYRDAWAIGFSRRYTVGVWMGNLDRQPMSDVTGSTGPALVLRATFAELERRSEPAPLLTPASLTRVKICKLTGQRAGKDCPSRDELYQRGSEPERECYRGHTDSVDENSGAEVRFAVRMPSPGLVIALDPRIPDDLEALPLEVSITKPDQIVEWSMDGELIGKSSEEFGRLLWTPVRGRHQIRAFHQGVWSDAVGFVVK